MTRNPWELLFYCDETTRAVGLPYAEPRILFGIARYYGVTHFIHDTNRPGLGAFIKSGHPALQLLVNGPLPIYSIDFAKFGEDELAPESEFAGYARRLKSQKRK
jgi:hypothetical protein